MAAVLTPGQLARTVDSIAATQQPSGALPWPDGHTDPWDHVECTMALTVGGRLAEATRAYEWLARTQQTDGSWAASYDELRVLDPTVDTNQCAYLAVGLWQWVLVTGDKALPERMWPRVRAALDFVVGAQAADGRIRWSRDPQGRMVEDALLTGSASTYQALRCGLALGGLFGGHQPAGDSLTGDDAAVEQPAFDQRAWERAAGMVQHAVAEHPRVFLDKQRYSMDWYYPALAGVVTGARARDRLTERWTDFVVPGLGARCVADRPWVTGAETAELAIALAVAGEPEQARRLLSDVQHLRDRDGSYWTGLVFDDGVRWPVERSSWTAAAMVLACDALAGGTTLDLFAGRDLPTGAAPESCALCTP